MREKIMKSSSSRNRRWLLALVVVLLLNWTQRPSDAHHGTHESKLNRYIGYSHPEYDGWVRESRYIRVRDGVKLAADLFLPTKKGAAVVERLPAIWTFDRYHRADLKTGKLTTQLDESPWLETMLKYGYIVCVVDVRGSGASFGTRAGEITPEDARDAYDITEWLAAQAWCNKRIGMFGRSYMGIAQYLAAGQAPPHLRAIFPEMALFDLYSFIRPGGVYREDYAKKWGEQVHRLDAIEPAAAVDGDANGETLKTALRQHLANRNVFSSLSSLAYRDSALEPTIKPYLDWNPAAHLLQIKKSHVAVYILAGWYDIWSRDALLWFNNLDNPRKLVVGPWAHTEGAGLDLAIEHLRWFDYWLKGIENGIMKEPPIAYYTIGGRQGSEWRSASQWPLPEQKPTNLYFRSGPSGKIGSINDGALDALPPTANEGKDEFRIDYSATSGDRTRWTNGYGGPFGYRDQSPKALKGLTYTSPQLNSPLEVTGHPIVRLWATSAAKDYDVFVYLEEVDEYGFSKYVTEGALKASHRKTAPASFNHLGLPFHRGFSEDMLEASPEEPVELVIDLHPISTIFSQKNFIRVTITGADKDNAQTSQQDSPPVVRYYRNARHASSISLPIISGDVPAPAPEPPAVVAQSRSGGKTRVITFAVFIGLLALAAAGIIRLKLSKHQFELQRTRPH
jgi:uncharacterized protein